jgi:Tfp pilus assembly protein PilF
MRWFAWVMFAALVQGCAVAPTQSSAQLFDDQRFQAPSASIDAHGALALSAGMRRFLDEDMRRLVRAEGAQRALVWALSSRTGLRLTYDASSTRTAAEAFEARSGNCLSLALMAGALARELGLGVTYQSGLNVETVSRNGSLQLTSGHVNLRLGNTQREPGTARTTNDVVIDFLPESEIRGLRTRVIGEQTVLAMFMNNRAVEALSRGAIDDAYWWARGATLQDPTFLAAVNTLAVVYMRHGDTELAHRALRHVVQLEPGNAPALTNLVQVLERQQRYADAEQARARLRQLEPHPPYYFFDRGMAALKAGDPRAASDLFAQELKRAAYDDEFHFWLGVAHLRSGNTQRATAQFEKAAQYTHSSELRELYAGKLAWVRSHQGDMGTTSAPAVSPHPAGSPRR